MRAAICILVNRCLALLFFCCIVYNSASAQTAEADAFDFYLRGPYRAGVPRPSAVLGYEPGKTHSTFRDQERVILAIAAAAKDRVRLVEYGKSVEGRPLRLVLVTSPSNLGKLEEIRWKIAKLADPRTLKSTSEGDEIVRSSPCITWINHCIHGDETASFETAMWTLYTLAASESPEVLEALKQSVVILNPVFNPDGHERFVVMYTSLAVGSPERYALEKHLPWGAAGRFNHYRFDMNRDKLSQSQDETRQETAAYLRWNPQVFADQHGQPEIYFFPPNSQSVNRNTDRARIEKWTTVFGKTNGASFDKYGWPYVTRQTYDFFGPFYLDTWSSLSGAIGMTYETDGGGSLARRRDDETIGTLRDAMAHHFETALATIITAARNREDLLRDFLSFKRNAIEEGRTGKIKRIVVLPGKDPGRAAEFASVLHRVGVEVYESTAPMTLSKAHSYMEPPASAGAKAGTSPSSVNPQPSTTVPAGALVIELAQPQGRVASEFLEPDADFEPEFMKEQLKRREINDKKNDNERKEGYDFYDLTAWSLPYAFGFEAYWCEDAPVVESHLVKAEMDGSVRLSTANGGVNGKATTAYLYKNERDSAGYMSVLLQREGYRVAATHKPIRANGKEWPRGTFVVRTKRNPEAIHSRIAALSKELGVEVVAVNSGYSDEGQYGINSEEVVSLRRPAIAVVADDMVDTSAYGAVWYTLERQFGLDFTPIRIRQLLSSDLSRFNVIIFPSGFGYTGALGKSGMEALKAWTGKGNVLIGLGHGGIWFTEKDAGLTTAIAVGSEPKPKEKPGAPKPDETKKPKKPVDVPGAMFRAKLDLTHFLCFGYEKDELAVPLGGAIFLKASTKGSNPVTFGKSPLRLSGFTWPDNTDELLAGTSYVIDEPEGSGHAILFLSDPTFRAMWPGMRKMLLNAILFGPRRAALTTLGAE